MGEPSGVVRCGSPDARTFSLSFFSFLFSFDGAEIIHEVVGLALDDGIRMNCDV